MHIIALENEPSSRRGGQELSLFDVCQGLGQRGHAVTLLYRRPGDLLEKYKMFCRETISIRQYRVEMRQPLTSIWQLMGDLNKVSVTKESLVYSNQYHDSFLGMVLARSRRLPFVCHLRLPPPPTLGWQWSLGMKSAQRLIAVSQQTKKEWTKRGFSADRIDVVYNGIDTNRFVPTGDIEEARSKLQLPSSVPIVAYVGRLDKPKGVETLIYAFKIACEQGLTAHLAIAGKPHNQRQDYGQELASLVKNLGIENQVTFLGHVSQPELVYQASDVLVLPSEWPEPFGRTLIEAMACGIPVIGSQVGGIPEILGGPFAEGLFEAGKAEELAQKIQRFAVWRQLDIRLGKRCRNHVLKSFTLATTLDKVESTLHRTLKGTND